LQVSEIPHFGAMKPIMPLTLAPQILTRTPRAQYMFLHKTSCFSEFHVTSVSGCGSLHDDIKPSLTFFLFSLAHSAYIRLSIGSLTDRDWPAHNSLSSRNEDWFFVSCV
jgi:hypothetical protein